MAPNTTSAPPPLEMPGEQEGGAKSPDPYFQNWWSQIVWRNVVYMALLHGVAAYGLLTIPVYDNITTHIYSLFAGLVGGFGVTAGAHRLWTHRSYKANTPLRILLAICFSMAGENTIFDWVRDHRVHHKFSETDADPHNAKRGFFFAHMGWLMMRKHPEVIRKGRQIDMSDILADPVVTFHTKYFTELKIMFCFILPTIVPHYMWGETWYNSILLSVWRYVAMLNSNWLVNSAAHIWGYRPYDKRINPAENIAVAFLTMGEGWHNYHHVFPWDYRAAELGSYALNMTTFYLDLFAKIGWAHDLKCPSRELVERVATRYGDGSHPQWGGHVQEVGEEEDTNKKVLHSSADHFSESEEDLDKILSKFSSTDSKEEEETVIEEANADPSQGLAGSSSLLKDMKSNETSCNHISVPKIKSEKITDSPQKFSNRSIKYRNDAHKTPDTVYSTLRYKNPMFCPTKVADSKVGMKNCLSMNCAVPNGIIKGKEVINSHLKPVASYFITKNGVTRNETPIKKPMYEASAGSAEEPNRKSNCSTNFNKNISMIKTELITESKSLGGVVSEERFCKKDMKAVEDKDKKIS